MKMPGKRMDKSFPGRDRMDNYKCVFAYDGTRYSGWEHQPNRMTVQGKIEAVLGRMCGFTMEPEDFMKPDCPISVIAAGRTDAGVHAKGMCVSVRLPEGFSEEDIQSYLNRYLPDDIAALSVRRCSIRFHARYNATGKTYRYTICDGPVRPVFDRKYYTYVESRLDENAMQKAAALLIGKHDFKSFCGNGRMKKSTIRTVDTIAVQRGPAPGPDARTSAERIARAIAGQNPVIGTSETPGLSFDYLTITVHGNGFLQNMVRILSGTLIEVGQHKRAPGEMTEILEAKDRRKAGPTAPAKGLCLICVDYE